MIIRCRGKSGRHGGSGQRPGGRTELRDLAYLFRDLATLRTDLPLFESVDALRWDGPTPEFAPLAGRLTLTTP